MLVLVVFFFKQKTAYEMRISDWSSDVCSSDLPSRERDCSRANTRRARQRRKGDDMTMTRDFKETVKERAGRDPAFAKALLDEAATLFLNRSEEHTSELQSLMRISYAVFCLKKKKTKQKSSHKSKIKPKRNR